MKTKVLFVLFALVSLVFTTYSCNNDCDNNEIECCTNPNINTLQESLDSLNQGIRAKLGGCCTRGVGCNCNPCGGHCSSSCNGRAGDCCGNQQQGPFNDTINVVLQDAAGAVNGAAAGVTLGGGAGTVTLPLIGTIGGSALGAVIGGMIGGIAGSWSAWNNYEVANGHTTIDSLDYNNIVCSYDCVMSVDTIIMMQNSEILTLPNKLRELRPVFKYASIHNSTLDILLADSMDLHGYTIRTIPLSVIDSIENKYNSILEANHASSLSSIPTVNINQNVNTVFSAFSEIVLDRATSSTHMDVITESYLDYIQTHQMSSHDRIMLLLAVSICRQSYQYWTNI